LSERFQRALAVDLATPMSDENSGPIDNGDVILPDFKGLGPTSQDRNRSLCEPAVGNVEQ
jgi:hypothetical protein